MWGRLTTAISRTLPSRSESKLGCTPARPARSSSLSRLASGCRIFRELLGEQQHIGRLHRERGRKARDKGNRGLALGALDAPDVVAMNARIEAQLLLGETALLAELSDRSAQADEEGSRFHGAGTLAVANPGCYSPIVLYAQALSRTTHPHVPAASNTCLPLCPASACAERAGLPALLVTQAALPARGRVALQVGGSALAFGSATRSTAAQVSPSRSFAGGTSSATRRRRKVVSRISLVPRSIRETCTTARPERSDKSSCVQPRSWRAARTFSPKRRTAGFTTRNRRVSRPTRQEPTR